MKEKTSKLTFNCEICNKTFESYKCYGVRRFCSNKCHGISIKGKPNSCKGKHWKLTEETKTKMRESAKKRKEQEWYPSFIEKVRKAGLANKNRKHSKETREKMSIYQKLHSKRYWFGKKNDLISGENHPMWKGGITTLKIKLRKSADYRRWRKAVYERDGYTCQLCGDSSGGNLEADHYPVLFMEIYTKEDKSLLWDINNGRTLCNKCHKQVTEEQRKSGKHAKKS